MSAEVQQLREEVAALRKEVSDMRKLVIGRMSVNDLQTATGARLDAGDLARIVAGERLVFQNLMFTPPELDE